MVLLPVLAVQLLVVRRRRRVLVVPRERLRRLLVQLGLAARLFGADVLALRLPALRLLGAHVMGPDAATVIQPLIQAMSFGQPAKDLARGQYWIHPALPEVVENALLKLDLP